GIFFFFSSRRRHTRFSRDWSSDVCSSDLLTMFVVCPFMENSAIPAMRPVCGHTIKGKLKYYCYTFNRPGEKGRVVMANFRSNFSFNCTAPAELFIYL